MYDVEISPRLMPGIRLPDGTWISVEATGRTNGRGKPAWYYFIDGPGFTYSEADLAGYGNARQMLSTLLSFLSAAVEAKQYEDRTGRESENADLFPEHVVEWALDNSDDIQVMQFELEEE